MKQILIQIFLLLFSGLVAISFIIKLVLWLRLKSTRKVGFIRSFIVFFSVHDIHNASSRGSKNFRRYNNILNYVFLTALFALAIVYVFNTNDVNGFIPTKQEAKDYKIK